MKAYLRSRSDASITGGVQVSSHLPFRPRVWRRNGMPSALQLIRDGAAGAQVELAARIYVLKPHNVVFAQVSTGLHLDQIKRNLTRVLETVNATEREKG